MSSITTQIHSLAAEVKARFYQTMVRLHIQLTRINKRNVIKKQNAIIILKHWIGINRKALYFYLCFATNDSIRVLVCVFFLISFSYNHWVLHYYYVTNDDPSMCQS